MELKVKQSKKSYKKARMRLLWHDFLIDKGLLRIIAAYLLVWGIHMANRMGWIDFLPDIFQVIHIIFGVMLIGMLVYVLSNILSQYAVLKKDLAQLYEGVISFEVSDKGIRFSSEEADSELLYWYKIRRFYQLGEILYIFPSHLNGPLIVIPKSAVIQGSWIDLREILDSRVKYSANH